ncbi:hypothetical protein L209DRAFT_301596 [Thermothelomyces heterothallicus CBS 203.75]
MNDLSRMSDVEAEVAAADDGGFGRSSTHVPSPAPKTRSLSDGGNTPKLSPSPHIVEASLRQSKDDIAIRDKDHEHVSPLPSTPIRAGFAARGLALQMPQRDAASPASQPGYVRPATLSPKPEHPYASPSNILPRHSRGMDFSRAATSLHHSTLAHQASPDSSPTIATIGSRAMNIPGRRSEYGGADQPSTSLWSMMGNQERSHVSSSMGSTSHAISDSSSSSDDDDYMDEDMEEAFVTTPQAQKPGTPSASAAMGAPWMPGSPAASNLLSFQQRQRHRKVPKRKLRGPLGLGFHPAGAGSAAAVSKSPPNTLGGSNDMFPHARRESISWAANQLHISGNESDDSHRQSDGVESPLRPSIVRRAVTRRGNLLPKTKGFARIRAALAEESAPIEAEVRREAEVIRQVRESDMDLEPRHPPPQSIPSTALSSPNLAAHNGLEEITDDIMMMDPTTNPLGVTGTLKQQALRNAKGKVFWDTASETSSTGATQRVTPPPPSLGPRASSSGISLEDISMASPSASSNGGASQGNLFVAPGSGTRTTTSSSGHGTPSYPAPTHCPNNNSNNNNNNNSSSSSTSHSHNHPSTGNNNGQSPTVPGGGTPGGSMPAPPTAAEITRRFNSKRRRGDDDLDPVSIKRRAVSPSMSVHNSPVMQSPLQRDTAPWGNTGGGGPASGGPGSTVSMSSRPGSVSGDGSGGGGTGRSGSGPGSENGSSHGNSSRGGGKGRIGFQGMVETNDGITRLSIE